MTWTAIYNINIQTARKQMGGGLSTTLPFIRFLIPHLKVIVKQLFIYTNYKIFRNKWWKRKNFCKSYMCVIKKICYPFGLYTPSKFIPCMLKNIRISTEKVLTINLKIFTTTTFIRKYSPLKSYSDNISLYLLLLPLYLVQVSLLPFYPFLLFIFDKENFRERWI